MHIPDSNINPVESTEVAIGTNSIFINDIIIRIP